MNAVGVKTRVAAGRKATNVRFPSRLSMYDSCDAPANFSIEDFETYALDRIQVLKSIETAKVRNKKDDEFRLHVKHIEEAHLPLHGNNLATSAAVNLDQEREKDLISHFILRLAYCKTEDLRRWFVTQEVALFKYRFETEGKDGIDAFIRESKLHYTPIPKEEKEALGKKLLATTPQAKDLNEVEFYKVPFEQALDLVAQRRVLLSKGSAYVPSTELGVLLATRFRTNLSKSLLLTARALPKMEEDERLLPILDNLAKQQVLSSEYTGSAKAGDITADDVDKLVQHFPLCMRHLHAKLNEDHHLKHGGRLQYGLFLKAIGLSLDEALLYWKRAFQPKINDEKFNKNYSYNIRHNYGQEGKRTNYSSHSCVKIITGNQPSTGDHHGCPFRHFSPDNLRATLRAYQAPEASIHEMLELVKNNHYQVACTRYYEITHKTQGQVDLIDHPNAYFDLSMGKVNPNGYHYNKDKENQAASSSSASQPASSSSGNKGPAPSIFQGSPLKGKAREQEKGEEAVPAAKKLALEAIDEFDSMLVGTGIPGEC